MGETISNPIHGTKIKPIFSEESRKFASFFRYAKNPIDQAFRDKLIAGCPWGDKLLL